MWQPSQPRRTVVGQAGQAAPVSPSRSLLGEDGEPTAIEEGDEEADEDEDEDEDEEGGDWRETAPLLLAAATFFTGLDGGARAALLGRLSLVKVRRGEVVIEEGRPAVGWGRGALAGAAGAAGAGAAEAETVAGRRGSAQLQAAGGGGHMYFVRSGTLGVTAAAAAQDGGAGAAGEGGSLEGAMQDSSGSADDDTGAGAAARGRGRRPARGAAEAAAAGRVRLGTLSPPDFFGELSLLLRTGGARAATVTAESDCELLELGQRSFEALLAADPSFHAQLKGRMDKLQLLRASAPALYKVAEQNPVLLYELLASMHTMGMDAGDVAFARGDSADCLYLLKSGSLQLEFAPGGEEEEGEDGGGAVERALRGAAPAGGRAAAVERHCCLNAQLGAVEWTRGWAGAGAGSAGAGAGGDGAPRGRGGSGGNAQAHAQADAEDGSAGGGGGQWACTWACAAVVTSPDCMLVAVVRAELEAMSYRHPALAKVLRSVGMLPPSV
jgi:CRP-like cAMP-binding protein